MSILRLPLPTRTSELFHARCCCDGETRSFWISPILNIRLPWRCYRSVEKKKSASDRPAERMRTTLEVSRDVNEQRMPDETRSFRSSQSSPFTFPWRCPCSIGKKRSANDSDRPNEKQRPAEKQRITLKVSRDVNEQKKAPYEMRSFSSPQYPKHLPSNEDAPFYRKRKRNASTKAAEKTKNHSQGKPRH